MGKGLSLSANEKAVVGRLVKVEGQAGGEECPGQNSLSTCLKPGSSGERELHLRKCLPQTGP